MLRKLTALVLAVVMVLGVSGAMADVGTVKLSTLEVKNESRFVNNNAAQGAVDTELWLRVDASGQIDVTVPLVLIFSTNLDGGQAITTDQYIIKNNNTRSSIGVKKIEVDPTNSFSLENGSKTMTLKSSVDTANRNEYSVVFNPTKDSSDTVTDLGSNASLNLATLNFGTSATGSKDYVWKINQNGKININPTMTTTALDFVTTQGDNGADQTMGVKLLRVTYTVGHVYDTLTGSALITNVDEELNVINANHTHEADYE